MDEFTDQLPEMMDFQVGYFFKESNLQKGG